MVAELRRSEVRKLAQASRGRRKKGALVIECDELWSFVGDKGNKQWVWLAMDRATREIVGCHVGARDEAGAVALWQSLPECYLDQVGKKSGQTNHIERFNNTLRQRCPRLVRKTLSFSKNFDNHIGAIWTFIHHYNKSLPL